MIALPVHDGPVLSRTYMRSRDSEVQRVCPFTRKSTVAVSGGLLQRSSALFEKASLLSQAYIERRKFLALK